MTHDDAFDRTVSAWLHEQADWTSPGYLDEILMRTRRARQRPSWSGVDRWLPTGWAFRLVPAARTGWLLLVLAVVAALATAALLAGSRAKLPPPFGEAGNGVVLYGAGNGDLYALDVETGKSTPFVAGAPADETPEFSHDGSKFVFARAAEAAGRWFVMVADADGGNVRALTGPVDPRWNAWSPDDTHVAVADAAAATLTLYRLDGRAPLTLDTGGRLATTGAFRPDGREIVFIGSAPKSYGIYVVATSASSAPRTLVAPVTAPNDISGPLLSPDGTLLAYTRWEINHSVIHLVDLETGIDRPIRLDPESDGENTAAWSPDGSQLLFHSHRDGSFQLAAAAVAGGQIALLGPVVPEGTGGAIVVFSPDGRTIIARYDNDGSPWLLDVDGGPATLLAIDAPAAITWQRVVRD
ncbi:MAG: hypothetical protein ABIR64_08345 [Candidatus Limnocylindrales bacterium]